MPAMPIVDSHVHLLDPARVALRWAEDAPELGKRRHLLAELDAERQDVEIEAIVVVEADAAAGLHFEEVDLVEEVAANDSRVAAMVAHAPLELGDTVAGQLEKLAERPLVRGVRRLIQGEAEDWCLAPDFVRGVQRLPAHDLHFEICIFHPQMAAAVELVRQCPDVRFVLDHIGKPGIKDGVVEPWRTQIAQMAALPNVVCKLSGMVTEADHQAWTAAQLRPYVEHVVACFGFDRLMFGSDWPVAKLACNYQQWVRVLDEILLGLSSDEAQKLYRDNARAIYRLS